MWYNYIEPDDKPNPISGQKRQKWNIGFPEALQSLSSAAKSVGIEEKDFDKYLVIKL